MRVVSLAVLLFLLALPSGMAAEQPLPAPPPADWLKQADLYGQVARMGPAQDPQVIEWALAQQQRVSSGFLFDASRRLLAAGRFADALEWYAIALMRGHYDAGRCHDSSAKRAVGGLARQAAVVARYGNNHAKEFGEAGMKALARTDLFTHSVPPDWVCAQGLTGMGGQSAGTIAPNLWAAIEASVREEFTKQFGQMSRGN